jgi:signal transduction histidine kinase
VEHPVNTALGWKLPGWLLDWAPVVFVALVGVGMTLHPLEQHRWLTIAALGATTAALAMRHRKPLATLFVVLVIAAFFGSRALVVLPVLLALFTVVEYTDRVPMAVAVAAAGIVVLFAQPLHGVPLTYGGVLSRLVAVGLAVSAALYIRARADYIAGLQDRAERLERERELLSEQSLNEERVRIARELHDVVAHNVSLMVVQAQALAATGTHDPEEAESLGRVADLGREAMSEMHRMLGVLRVESGAEAERAPQPGVRNLDSLLTRTREAGLATDLAVVGVARDLPPGVDLSIYRIVQEALTNVIRHAGASRATVTLSYLPEAVEVAIVDDGRGSSGTDSDGHGLVGMRERAALFGGRLDAGVASRGEGFMVRAVLPLAS